MKNFSSLTNWLKISYYRTRLANPLGGKYKLQTLSNLSPFFIIGSGRSGNTLLRRILNNHSQLFIPPETYVLGSVINTFQIFRGARWEEIVVLVYSKFEMHPEFETFGLDSLSELKKEMIHLPKSKRALDTLLNGFYLFYARKHNIEKIRWGDKTPINTFIVSEIKKVLPNSKFIHIIRNPFDSIYSYVQSGIYKNYENATKRWLRSVLLAKKNNIKSDNYFEVYYEDLVKQPKAEIQRVCDFLDIDFEEEMLGLQSQFLGDVDILIHHKNVMKPISTVNINKGVRNLSEEDLNSIKEIILKKNTNKYIKKVLIKYRINF